MELTLNIEDLSSFVIKDTQGQVYKIVKVVEEMKFQEEVNEIVSLTELSRRLKKAPSTIKKWIARGMPCTCDEGNRFSFSIKLVNQWREEQMK